MKALVALALSLLAAPAFAADLTGVWWIEGYRLAARTVEGAAPPLLSAARATYEANLAAAKRGDRGFDGAARCLPPGLPRLMLMDQPFEILQRPGTVYFLHQLNRLPRRAYVGEAHPPTLDVTYLGHSVARWEGETLVVDTVKFNDQTVLDDSGLPHSDALHVVERYRLLPGGRRMQAEITIDDPGAYARPWTMQVSYVRKPALRIEEQVCADGMR